MSRLWVDAALLTATITAVRNGELALAAVGRRGIAAEVETGMSLRTAHT